MELPDEERFDLERRTYDCPPTLTDNQVLEFCQQGFLVLEGVVPDEINRRTFVYLEENAYFEPAEILKEGWFVDNVILNPQAAGAVRSLLGKNFGLPIMMSQHRVKCPMSGQSWHRDAGSKWGPELNYLQVFYYPQDTSEAFGPTEVSARFTPFQRVCALHESLRQHSGSGENNRASRFNLHHGLLNLASPFCLNGARDAAHVEIQLLAELCRRNEIG